MCFLLLTENGKLPAPTHMLKLALATLTLASCVATTGDLDRIHMRIEQGEERIEVALVQFEAGLVEAEEVTGAVRKSLADTKAEVKAVAEDVSERPGLWSRFALEIMLAAVGVAVPSAVGATNLVRNRARVKRGEPVRVPKAAKRAPSPKMGAE